MSIKTQSKKTIYRVLMATMVIGYFWGLYFQAPSIIKLFFSLLIWGALLVFPYRIIVGNTFSKSTNLFLKLLLIMGLVQILRSVISNEPLMSTFGNKWFTLFFNEYTSLLFVPPLFVYLGNKDYNVIFLKNATERFLLIGAFFILIMKFPLAFMVLFVGVFFPYVEKRFKILILLSFLEAIYCGATTVRACLIMIFFFLMAFILPYFIKSKLIMKSFCLLFAAAPLALALSVFSMGATKESALDIIMQDVASETDNKKMSTDTRSFLYLEMAQDLTLNDSWTFGKGAIAHYYSESFLRKNDGDHYNRLVCEVPFLNYLMHGGLVYVIIYFGLILLAVFKGINGNNKFVQSASLLALGWYFNSFIGDLNGCRFYHLGVFLLLGVCLSPHWRTRTDDQVRLFFKGYGMNKK